VISHDRFLKSSYSGGVNCVEVRLLPDGRVALRDSKDPSLAPHHFTSSEWNAFLAGVRAGEFNLDEEADGRPISRVGSRSERRG
jgi:hypothetical protein